MQTTICQVRFFSRLVSFFHFICIYFF
uniref:Uncharacterized protein n=1 Tax=Arundo donax TaxID=35708 RepID=A0A0A9FHZ2_ARUDO